MLEPKVEFWDRLGITASAICIVHCVATPLVLMTLPFLAEHADHNHDRGFHWGMAAIIGPIAVLALWRGYRLHKKKFVLALGTIGLSCILLGLFAQVPLHGILLTVTGGGFLLTAHLKNLRACQSCHSAN